MTEGEPLYPLFLRLSGREVLVVGAGAVAERKIGDLVRAAARVRVVAPEATAEVSRLAADGAIEWRPRPFVGADVDGAWLVVAAAPPDVQAAVSRACEARRVHCLAVDDVPHATAFGGSIIRRPPFLIALSSSGEAPALTRLVRQVIERALPEERWVTRARELRRAWRRDGTPMGERFEALVREIAAELPKP